MQNKQGVVKEHKNTQVRYPVPWNELAVRKFKFESLNLERPLLPRWTTLLGQQGLNGAPGPGPGRKEGNCASKKGAAPSPGNHYLRTKRSSRARKRQNFRFAGEQLSTIVRRMVNNRSKSFRLLGKNLKHWPLQYLTVDHNLKMSCQG